MARGEVAELHHLHRPRSRAMRSRSPGHRALPRGRDEADQREAARAARADAHLRVRGPGVVRAVRHSSRGWPATSDRCCARTSSCSTPAARRARARDRCSSTSTRTSSCTTRTSRPVPLWYDEGFAEFMGTLRIDERRDRDRRGADASASPRPLTGRALVLRQDPPDAQPRHAERDATRDMFYLQSWEIVHYLMLGPGRELGQRRRSRSRATCRRSSAARTTIAPSRRPSA